MKRYWFLLTLLPLLFASCKPDDPPDPVNSPWIILKPVPDFPCETIPPQPGGLGYILTHPSYSYSAPAWSYFNTGDIAYLRALHDNMPLVHELRRINLATGESELLFTGVSHQPDWSSRGRIAFTDTDRKVVHVKADGTDPVWVQGTTWDLHPKWHPDGKLLGFMRQRADTSFAWAIMHANEKGEVVDSIRCEPTVHRFCWSPDGKKAALVCGFIPGEYSIRILDPADCAEEEIIGTGFLPAESSIGMVDWSPDGKNLYWTSDAGMYKTDLITRNTTLLRESCPSRFIAWCSISPDGRYLAYDQQERTVMPDSLHLYMETHVQLMNLQTGAEYRVEFPE